MRLLRQEWSSQWACDEAVVHLHLFSYHFIEPFFLKILLNNLNVIKVNEGTKN